MNYLLVCVGGAAGSLARYSAGREITKRSKSAFPFGTFIINIAGAFLLGIVSSIHAGTNAYFWLGDGFLGAFTTFSTFMYEGFHLFEDNDLMNAFTYIGVSFILGISGYILGIYIAGLLFLR